MITVTRRHVGEKEWEKLEFPTFSLARQAAFGYKHVSIQCDSCAACMIQGVPCHETGCPEAWRDETRECRDCGCDFKPESRYQVSCCQGDNNDDELPPETESSDD